MEDGASSAAAGLLRFSGRLIAASSLLMLLGWFPTIKLGGRAGVYAMLAGCGVSLCASLAGALAVGINGDSTPSQWVSRLLASTAIRVTLEVGVVLALALSGVFARVPLVIWAAISYLALLPLDTLYASDVLRTKNL